MASRPAPEVLSGMVAAQEFRIAHGLGGEPIADLWDLIRDMGVDLAFAPFEGGADGLYQWDGRRALIVVNTAVGDLSRQRFTAAHELGHHVLHGGQEGEPLEVVDEDIYALDSDPEREANAFAAYLLAPDTVMRSAFADKARRDITVEDVAWLAHRYGLSFQSTVFRLHNSGRILAEDRDRLIEQSKGQIRKIQRAKGYDRETIMPGDPLPGWYVLQVVEMARTGVVELQRAAELLRRSPEEVSELLAEDEPVDDGAEAALRELLGDDIDALLTEGE